MVSVGVPLADTRIAICRPGHPFGRWRRIGSGRFWVGGPTVAGGYLDLPEDTARTFEARIEGTGEGPFLRTGNLGFLRDGELYVCGRLKDLVILRGKSHHPVDIEATVEQSHPAVRLSSTAAIAVDDDGVRSWSSWSSSSGTARGWTSGRSRTGSGARWRSTTRSRPGRSCS